MNRPELSGALGQLGGYDVSNPRSCPDIRQRAARKGYEKEVAQTAHRAAFELTFHTIGCPNDMLRSSVWQMAINQALAEYPFVSLVYNVGRLANRQDIEAVRSVIAQHMMVKARLGISFEFATTLPMADEPDK